MSNENNIASVTIPFWTLYRNPLPLLRNIMLNHGERVRIKTPWPVYLINEPELTYHILKQTNFLFDKSVLNYTLLGNVIGRGLVTNEGQAWKVTRDIVKPYFNHNHIDELGGAVACVLRRMTEKWDKIKGTGETVDVSIEMTHLAFDIMAQFIFGSKTAESPVSLITELEKLDFTTKEGFLMIFKYFPMRRQQEIFAIHKQLDAFLMESARQSDLNGSDCVYRAMRAGLSEKQLKNELKTLLFAGHSTIANLLTWCLYLLALEERHAANIYHEAHAHFSSENDRIEETTKCLPCTANFIKETLRLFPPVWILPRRCIQGHEFGNFSFKKYVVYWVVPWTLHRNPNYWKDPEAFLPERFVSSDNDNFCNKAYIPFSTGPRMCLGKQFGITESVYILASLAKKYRFVVSDNREIEFCSMISIKPKHRVRLMIQ